LLLRPLRLFANIREARQHLEALVKAVPNFLSVAFFLFYFFFSYAVLGLYMFSDSTYYRCRETFLPVNATYWPKNPGNLWCDPVEKNYCPNGQVCGTPG